MFLCFVKNNTNDIFFHVFVLIFCSIETTTNDCFFSRIIVQFDFFCFYFLWKSITWELFSHVRFCFLWFSKNYKKNLCIRIKLLWFLENNNRLIFSICRYTSIWSFLFLLKFIRTELFPRIRLYFLWFCEKTIQMWVFPCKITLIYVVLLKKHNFSYFPCITQKFDFYAFVKI
jgi:hypothetical protein